jgi:hypothetical protein
VLRPASTHAPVVSELASLASSAVLIRGAIAYWTIDAAILGSGFTKGLAQAGGFLCLDIHLPTNIDHLATLRRAGAQVYLHLFDLVGHTEDVGVKGVPPHLMHAKMLLFDLDQSRATLWVGSHNATRRALYGVNVEASLLIDLDRSSANYSRAVDMLEGIRRRCDLMDPTRAAYYKLLQSGTKTANVIELEDSTNESVPRASITVFGTETADHRQLDKVGKEVFVSITSSLSGRERFYPARISQTGEMGRASRAAAGTKFDPRRYAFRRGSRLPLLLPVQAIAPEVYDEARYYVTLQLKDVMPEDTVAYEPPERPPWPPIPGVGAGPRPWVDVDPSEWCAHLPTREFSGKRGDRPPRLRRASAVEDVILRPLSLVERKQIMEHKLVRQRVFLRPDESE